MSVSYTPIIKLLLEHFHFLCTASSESEVTTFKFLCILRSVFLAVRFTQYLFTIADSLFERRFLVLFVYRMY